MLSVGIVGFPNVGKSSLFKALTRNEVEIANYPFATIEPNEGIVSVPDERLEKLAALEHSKKIIPTIVKFVDIAGLVKEAHKGAGLGNKFLAHIREVDAIVQVVRAFDNPAIIRNEGPVSPKDDIEIINLELEMGDIKKPTLYVINDDKGLSAKELLETYQLGELGINEEQIIPLNVKEELELGELTPQEQQELGVKSNLAQLIVQSYKLLNLITFLTTGPDETRAWTLTRGSSAPEAGNKIHNDFKEQFIRAEVIPWNKLLEAGGWVQAKAKGWVGTKGKDYIVQDGDVIEFKI